jgi:undecaprenyl diphosphate synthase
VYVAIIYLIYLEAEIVMGQDSDTSANEDAHRVPCHVAIIMDGNGRWATQRGRPRLFGHHAGAKRVREIVESCPDLGIKYLTIFAFSTENWKRTQVEVAGLMGLFRRYIARETRALVHFGVRVRFIGDRANLDAKLVSLMSELEEETAEIVG